MAVESLPTKEDRYEVLKMLFSYCLGEVQPESDNPMLKAMVLALLPSYDAAAVRYEKSKIDGLKGGRPSTIDHNRVYALRQEGNSLAEIAAEMGCTISGVKYALSKTQTDSNDAINNNSVEEAQQAETDSKRIETDSNPFQTMFQTMRKRFQTRFKPCFKPCFKLCGKV
jgi:Sec-independent protein translocase protein TatA